jgi:hypothetical protein
LKLQTICHYIQKVRKTEILRMKVEFLIDENQNVWFSSASDIHTRKAVTPYDLMNLVHYADPEEIERQYKEAQIALLQEELKQTSEYNDSKQKAHMLQLMNDHYSQIKSSVGFVEKNLDVADDS